MSQELQHLIDRIQSEGVEEAEKKAGEILAKAKADADRILGEANAQAESRLQEAEEQAALFDVRSRETLRQSGRNLLIHIGDRLSSILDQVVKNDVDAALSSDGLENILSQVIPAYLEANGQVQDLTVLVPEGEFKSAEALFQKKFGEALKNGLRIEADASIASGFMISGSGESAVHDFTSEAVAESLSKHLRPKLAEIIREAANLEASA